MVTAKRTAGLAVALMVPLMLAAPALAKEPTGDFARFAQCPRFTPGINFCVYSTITGGEVTIGTTTVPVTNPIVLQGGYDRNEEGEEVTETFEGALNGNTLSKSPQPVPGGLAGLVNCPEISNFLVRAACALTFENGLTGVNATTELARPASTIGISTDNLANEEGIALSLPVKVHLENPFLGSECYIGSNAKPVVLKLTSGKTSPPPPNTPIRGSAGKLENKDEGFIEELIGSKLVDNSFAAPEATGCGGLFAFLIDPLVNSKLGLPSAAGHNTAIQTGTEQIATAEQVIKHEA